MNEPMRPLHSLADIITSADDPRLADDAPPSFDDLAHEHNLSPRMRELCRLFFIGGVKTGRRQQALLERQQTPGQPS